MMRRTAGVILLLTGLVSWGAVASQQPPPLQGGRPNVVLVMSDDMGYADLGSYGAVDVRTPHIDSLARDGVRLTDFYANAALCTPTRAGLITGRYQQRVGPDLEQALSNASTAAAERGLPARGRSLPQLLRTSGYATALIGKWHLGYRPEFSPNAHGFDLFFGFKSGYVDFYTHTDGAGRPDLFENDTPAEATGYMTDLITERSIRFIEQHANRPFFIDVSYNAPHWPYQPPGQPSIARDNARHLMPHDPETGTRADYVAMVERVDWGVGEILRTLDRLGLAQNTIVIFTNDNGGEWLSDNGPLFHRKWTLWEGGIRVPLLIRWPGRIPAGRVSDQVGITMDLTASILAATGTEVPPGPALEGLNLLPILEGRSPDVERTLFWRTRAGNQVQRAVRSGEWKLIVDGNHPMVFNLATDVGERRDLANRRQDVARRLQGLLQEWERDVDAEARTHAPAAAGQ
jgi:arylsulfatase A-like enzyme